MATQEKGRGVLATIAGTRYGGPVTGKGPGLWSFPLLGVGAVALLGLGAVLPGGFWWPAAVAAALAAAGTARVIALTRADGWAARRELLAALRGLAAIPPDGAVLLSRDAHLVHIVDVKSVRFPLPWPFPWRWQQVTVTEVGEGYLASAAQTGSGHLTGRTFELLPWEAGVQVTVRDGTLRADGGEEAWSLFFRQWFPDERSVAGLLAKEWRGRRAGTLHASPGDVRVLAGMLATAEAIGRPGDGD